MDTYFEEVYEEYLEIQEAVDLFYEYYLETGSVDEAEAEVSDIMSAAIQSALDSMYSYNEELEEWEDLLEEAITVLFENLNSGLTLTEALETDKAIRASIAVSADLGDAIQTLSDMLDDGVSIDDAYDLTEDIFDDSYAEAAAVLMEMDELETE